MKTVLIAVSVLLNLAVGVVVAWVVFGSGTQSMMQDFLGPHYDRSVSQFEALPVQPGDIVFLGDSITEGGRWGEWFAGRPVRNRGIGGDTSAGVLARLDQVISGRPAKVFLLIGTNDLAFNVPEADIVANVSQIIDRIHTGSPSTRVYLQSVMPRAVEYREQIESLNASIQRHIGERAEWVNLYPRLLDDADGSISNDFSNDELHLNGAGYANWREAIAPLVAEGR